MVVPQCYQPTIIQRDIYVRLRLCILSTEARVGGGCPAMLSAYHNTKRYLCNVTFMYLSTEARVGGGCSAMLSAYHNTKRYLCNVTFMYFINRGESWWWLSRDVISLP